jgi:hypothetical protein
MSKFLKDHPGDGGSWGINLRQTLSWCETNQTPFGFSKFEEENDSDMRDWVIEDVEREVGALLAAATERLFGKDGDLVPPILSERENAVLNVIPFGSAGALTGKQVIDRVKKQHNPNTERLDQAALTKDIIPKLKIFYSVRNRRGVGYYRKPPREKR